MYKIIRMQNHVNVSDNEMLANTYFSGKALKAG